MKQGVGERRGECREGWVKGGVGEEGWVKEGVTTLPTNRTLHTPTQNGGREPPAEPLPTSTPPHPHTHTHTCVSACARAAAAFTRLLSGWLHHSWGGGARARGMAQQKVRSIVAHSSARRSGSLTRSLRVAGWGEGRYGALQSSTTEVRCGTV